jgi:hypothetical protein
MEIGMGAGLRRRRAAWLNAGGVAFRARTRPEGVEFVANVPERCQMAQKRLRARTSWPSTVGNR